MYCNGIPSGFGIVRLLPGLGPVVAQHAGRLAGERPAANGVAAGGVRVRLLLHRGVLGFLHHQPLRAGPRALRAQRQRRGDLLAAADAACGQHRDGRDLLDDLRPQHDRADLAAVSARLAALGDDDVDAGVGVLARLRRRAAQRGDLAARVVDVLDHVGRRRAERVGDQRHLRMLRARPRPAGWPSPRSSRGVEGVVAAALDRHAVIGRGSCGRSRGAPAAPCPAASWSARRRTGRSPCPRTCSG